MEKEQSRFLRAMRTLAEFLVLVFMFASVWSLTFMLQAL
jgi:hypothetical protein